MKKFVCFEHKKVSVKNHICPICKEKYKDLEYSEFESPKYVMKQTGLHITEKSSNADWQRLKLKVCGKNVMHKARFSKAQCVRSKSLGSRVLRIISHKNKKRLDMERERARMAASSDGNSKADTN